MQATERWALGALVLVLIGLLALRWQGDGPVTALDRPAYDLLLQRAMPPRPAPEGVTVVLVDDESITRLGEQAWPISRGRWADFFEALAPYKPAAVGVDAWFETPAPKGDVELARDVVDKLEEAGFEEEDEGAEMVEWLEELATKRDGDRRFAEALAKVGTVILGLACLNTAADDATTADRTAHMKFIDVPVYAGRKLPCKGLATSLPQLTMSARGQGGLTVRYDSDGLIRRYPYVFRFGERPLPSLALATAMLASGDAATMRKRAVAHDHATPFLPMRRVGEFQQVRFSDVIEAEGSGTALKKLFEGKVVLVGVSALGTEDYVSTPLESDIPGVFVHAAAVDSLMTGDMFTSEGRPMQGAAAGSVMLLLVLIGLVRAKERASVVLAAAVVACALWIGLAVVALRGGAVIPVVPVLLVIVAWAAIRLTFQYVRAGEDRKRAKTIRSAFSHYLAPAVVETLIEHPDKLQLGGERKQITAFFSDVKGFTSISESMDPADLVRLLNEVLGCMTEIIIEEGGTVDKYIGDAIVAMWGAPIDQPDHAVRACRAALRCDRKLAELRPQWLERGYPEVLVRIGVNSGTALVGNMGSEQRFDYTMMGDTVNLAARLEPANNQYGTWIMAGEKTVKQALRGSDPVVFRELDALRVKGKKAPIKVFEVAAMSSEISDEQQATVDGYKAGLAAYRAQDWDAAEAALGPLAQAGDPPSAIFMDRIRAFRDAPPPEDWDGLFVMKGKS